MDVLGVALFLCQNIKFLLNLFVINNKKDKKNRDYIKEIMDKAGFDVLDTEWWHFTLRNQPFPDTYFDFDVK